MGSKSVLTRREVEAIKASLADTAERQRRAAQPLRPASKKFHADLFALIRKHDPQAKVRQFANVTIVTSDLVPLHSSLIFEPEFPVLAKADAQAVS